MTRHRWEHKGAPALCVRCGVLRVVSRLRGRASPLLAYVLPDGRRFHFAPECKPSTTLHVQDRQHAAAGDS